jgi:hypothetical protein
MKKAAVILTIAILTITFAVIGLLLWFRPESRRLIKWKLKVGALLLTLGGITATGCFRPPFVTCYATVPSNFISVDNYIPGNDTPDIILNPVHGIVQGSIVEPEKRNYSWILCSDDNEEIIRDTLRLQRTEDTYENPYAGETFKFQLPVLESGQYRLYIFDKPYPLLPSIMTKEEAEGLCLKNYLIRINEWYEP